MHSESCGKSKKKEKFKFIKRNEAVLNIKMRMERDTKKKEE
jgi:hypothetical protein